MQALIAAPYPLHVNADAPETHEAFTDIAQFFDRHLAH